MFLEFVYAFTRKKMKVPKVNGLASTSWFGNVSILIPCPPLPPLQMVHTRNGAEHYGIPLSWGNTLFLVGAVAWPLEKAFEIKLPVCSCSALRWFLLSHICRLFMWKNGCVVAGDTAKFGFFLVSVWCELHIRWFWILLCWIVLLSRQWMSAFLSLIGDLIRK